MAEADNNRIAQLELEVAQLKKLAEIDVQIKTLKKQKVGTAPKKNNFWRNFVIVLAVVVAAIVVAMPIISNMISQKFEAIGNELQTGQ